ncbi:MAG: hypothetical protein FD130_986 [Halothiobacillaceae bacterium]|nr:MAG: hypothetical protein FD130_986 [Halothiobacillaceae bacterium]
MNQFWKKIWDICRLRAAPQDLPASLELVLLSVAGYFGIGILISAAQLPLPTSLLAALVDVAMLLVASYVALWVKLWPHRWYQMVTALAGSGAIIGFIALPIVVMQQSMGTESPLLAIPELIMIAIMVWNLLIIAHILRHTLALHMVVAGLFSGLYMYLSLRVITILFFTVE